MAPSTPGGATSIVVAVDPFTEFVEAGPVDSLKSANVPHWFRENIVCRYGVPRWVRCDRGTEFLADFTAYCDSWGIIVWRITGHTLCANGQVERYNLLLR